MSLSNCPFCGSHRIIEGSSLAIDVLVKYVICQDCGAKGPEFPIWCTDKSYEDTGIRSWVAGWNNRVRNEGPGTIYARFNGVCEFAEEEFGHPHVSSSPPELAIYEGVKVLKEKIKHYETVLYASGCLMAHADKSKMDHTGFVDSCNSMLEVIDKILEKKVKNV